MGFVMVTKQGEFRAPIFPLLFVFLLCESNGLKSSVACLQVHMLLLCTLSLLLMGDSLMITLSLAIAGKKCWLMWSWPSYGKQDSAYM